MAIFPDEIEAWKRIREQSEEFNYCITCGKDKLEEWVDGPDGRQCPSCYFEGRDLESNLATVEYFDTQAQEDSK